MSLTAQDRPVHSDFIVHWTGKDIDKSDADWQRNDTCIMSPAVAHAYLKRLKSILRHGLWMTKEPAEATLEISRRIIQRPNPYRTCFTELRLSEVRQHARQYGRLGIGFKRFFLFDRMGAPMIYFQKSRPNWYVPPVREGGQTDAPEYFTAYLKEMSESRNRMMHYTYYNESEWRIIYDATIAATLANVGCTQLVGKFKAVDTVNDAEFAAELKRATNRPGYVIPIADKWFSLIIYPSLVVKALAHADKEIRELLHKMKPPYTEPTFDDGNPANFEANSPPIEMDLDACHNF